MHRLVEHALLPRALIPSLATHMRRMAVREPVKALHGRPGIPPASESDDRTKTTRQTDSSSQPQDVGDRNSAAQRLTKYDHSELLQFQKYVRERLAQITSRMPQHPSLQKRAELSFLEEQVVEDVMPRRKRRLRDPLKDVALDEIVFTNLGLLNRFVSESGAILPRKLTGVSLKKQKRLAQAIKRAQRMALMPIVWKDPKYRHATYANEYNPAENKFALQTQGDEVVARYSNC